MSSLAPGFLLAAPPLHDGVFERSVVLLASHDEEGAFGWVVNGSSLLSLPELLSGVDFENHLNPAHAELEVQVGGPVSQEQVWLLYPSGSMVKADPDEQVEVAPGICACASKSVLKQVADGLIIPELKMIAGYAGWEKGQLEAEVSQGAWLPIRADQETTFQHRGSEMWVHAFERAGISPIGFNSKIKFEA